MHTFHACTAALTTFRTALTSLQLFQVYLLASVQKLKVLHVYASASAFFVVTTLKNLARDGRTVIASIHQPSSEVFELFDNLFLLSGGKTVYFGAAMAAHQVHKFPNSLSTSSVDKLCWTHCSGNLPQVVSSIARMHVQI